MKIRIANNWVMNKMKLSRCMNIIEEGHLSNLDDNNNIDETINIEFVITLLQQFKGKYFKMNQPHFKN
jgi:hypothetical protein